MHMSPEDLRPLLRGHYTTPQVMWQALGRVAGFVAGIVTRRAAKAEREALVSDVLDDLAARVERGKGLPCSAPEDKLGPWFASCVANSARDVQRKQRRHDARFEPASDVDDEAGTSDRAAPAQVSEESAPASKVWDPLESDECPPNYRLALKAWHTPQRFSRRDVEAIAADVQQGKPSQKAGLARPVERAWPLLLQIAQRWPDGVARRRAAIDRFAFTVRSDAPKYSAWAADVKALRAARETVGKWHVRGRQWLRARLEAA